MYRRELENALNSGRIGNFMLLRGEDDFLNDFFAREIVNFWGAQEYQKVYFDEYDFSNLSDYLEGSLFANSHTLHIKMSKTIQIKELKSFLSQCERDENNHFLFELFEDGTRVSPEFIKAFGANFVRFFKPNSPGEVITLLNRKCIANGVVANQNALFEIYAIHSGNLALCAAEIDKFATAKMELNVANVRECVFGLSEISFDELFNKIFSLRDFKDDFFTYTQSGGYNETAFLNAFYGAIFRIFRVHCYIKTHGVLDIAKAIGYTPPINIANELKNYAVRFNFELFYKIFVLLNEGEFEIKSESNLDKSAFLLSKLLEIQRILSDNKSKF